MGWVPEEYEQAASVSGTWLIEYQTCGRPIRVIEAKPENNGFRLVLKRPALATSPPPPLRVMQSASPPCGLPN